MQTYGRSRKNIHPFSQMFHPVQDEDIMYMVCIQIKQAQIHNLHMIRYKLARVTVKTNN